MTDPSKYMTCNAEKTACKIYVAATYSENIYLINKDHQLYSFDEMV